MNERRVRGPKPRVRPQMNTETRRHDERSAYHRRTKYPDEPIIDEETDRMDEEGGGVLDDWTDETEVVDESAGADDTEKPPCESRGRG